MGTILQQRVPQQCPGRLCTERLCTERLCTERLCTERLCTGPGWRASSWSEHRPEADSSSTDQRRSQHLQETPPEEMIQKCVSRRMHRSTNRKSKHSSQVTPDSSSPVPPPSDHSQVRASVSLNKKKHSNPKHRRHTAAFPCHRALSDPSPDPAPRSALRDSGALRNDDSDTDLSESEMFSELPCGGPPPQLELRPEVISLKEPPLCSRNNNKSKFDFPDFLPPPFNSWSLNQLAYFYNMESRAASRPKPTGSLERYLERLLQLEWYQIKTWQDNNGPAHAEPLTVSHKSPASTSARLSTPKCILQCQRAFPLTILSMPSHCAYIVCTTRNSSCSCRSSGSQARPSRMSPTQEHRGLFSLPKRSYSESRAPLPNQTERPSGSASNQGHLKQMQAAGNLRSSVQAVHNRHTSNARDQGSMWKDHFPNHRAGCVRSGSVNRKSNSEWAHNSGEKRRGRSECRKGCERRGQHEVKPDAVNAIMDNLSATKSSAVNRPSRSKQVEFVT
ncbi:hypothetical protein NQD34_003837 [Periophthalmus magnuspinnatus]|nr:hypothetical protein NQD34_003837 [Periophthalmus magnuspinnatus]